jgi:hypothetical protein
MTRILRSDYSALTIATAYLFFPRTQTSIIIILLICIFIVTFSAVELWITKSRINDNSYVRVGTDEQPTRSRREMLILGFLLIGYGIFDFYFLHNLLNIQIMFIAGIFVLVYTSLRFDNFMFLIKKDSVLFVVSRMCYEWKNSKIEEVEIKGRYIYFKKKKTVLKYDLIEFSDQQYAEIVSYIKSRLKEKVIENKNGAQQTL